MPLPGKDNRKVRVAALLLDSLLGLVYSGVVPICILLPALRIGIRALLPQLQREDSVIHTMHAWKIHPHGAVIRSTPDENGIRKFNNILGNS